MRVTLKWWENPSGTESISSKSHGNVGSSSSSNSSRALKRGKMPLSPPTPSPRHPVCPRWGQGQLDKHKQEGQGEAWRLWKYLKWTSMAGSSIYSVGRLLVCQVVSTVVIFSRCWDLDRTVHPHSLWRKIAIRLWSLSFCSITQELFNAF